MRNPLVRPIPLTDRTERMGVARLAYPAPSPGGRASAESWPTRLKPAGWPHATETKWPSGVAGRIPVLRRWFDDDRFGGR